MNWETRHHWLWGLLLPCRWCLLLAILGLAGFTIRNLWISLAGILALAGAVIGFLLVLAQWRSFTILIFPEEQILWERQGFATIHERRINLRMTGSILFRQSPMGMLFDYGSLSIIALGGPYEWENLGNFRILRRMIENR